jgi:hypothetical protein
MLAAAYGFHGLSLLNHSSTLIATAASNSIHIIALPSAQTNGSGIAFALSVEPLAAFQMGHRE